MGTISQNAAFNQFHNIVVNESNIAFLPPPAAEWSIAVLDSFGVPLVCVTSILEAQNLSSVTGRD